MKCPHCLREIPDYQVQPRRLSAGCIVGIIFLCFLPIVLLLTAIAIPNFITARQGAIKRACIANLRIIEAAKQMWYIETNAARDVSPAWKDLVPRYTKEIPSCYQKGTYSIGTGYVPASCSIGDNGTLSTRDDHILPADSGR